MLYVIKMGDRYLVNAKGQPRFTNLFETALKVRQSEVASIISNLQMYGFTGVAELAYTPTKLVPKRDAPQAKAKPHLSPFGGVAETFHDL